MNVTEFSVYIEYFLSLRKIIKHVTLDPQSCSGVRGLEKLGSEFSDGVVYQEWRLLGLRLRSFCLFTDINQ